MVDGDQDYMRTNVHQLDNLEHDDNNIDKFRDENLYKYHENT